MNKVSEIQDLHFNQMIVSKPLHTVFKIIMYNMRSGNLGGTDMMMMITTTT